jgi:hypothetical protein
MGGSKVRVPENLILFERWMETTKWILERTARFPKRLRQSLTNRVENTALEILERVTTAAYVKKRTKILLGINDSLNRLRVLVRLSHELRLLSDGEYEQAARRLDEAGRVLGGWMKSNSEPGARPGLSKD